MILTAEIFEYLTSFAGVGPDFRGRGAMTIKVNHLNEGCVSAHLDFS